MITGKALSTANTPGKKEIITIYAIAIELKLTALLCVILMSPSM